MTVGVVGTGHMGAGLGWALREGGANVFTTLADRSERSERFAHDAGLTVVPDLDELVQTADVLLVITPPAAAREVAGDLARSSSRTGAHPLLLGPQRDRTDHGR